ncbi:MAG: hypothetical protein QG554_2131 [Pseudomonadota bacterium]|nr:hypothetical protein [Pseudomonadota bacterium]
MQKSQAVASLGQQGLLMPVWIKAALGANDRLKLYLTVLQAALAHAEHPQREALDLSHEMLAAGLSHATWLHELPVGASRVDGLLLVPELDRLVSALHDDLALMARPVLVACTTDQEPHQRVHQWQDWLDALHGEQLDKAQLHALTHGQRKNGDSLHLLIMDLHKQINKLAAEMAGEVIDGAHVWHLEDSDRTLVRAFMQGLHRTASLKFDHPGLDTAATRDAAHLAQTLTELGARIVFLIDWNRARKRLLNFVSKEGAVAVLTAAAQAEVGHMAWLKAGGEQLIFTAMQGAGVGAFRIGDRLDDVLGDAPAQNLLLEVMRLATQALLRGQPTALVADETRLLLARQVQRRTTEFDLLDEHAAYCHALAQGVSDALAHGHDGLRDAAQELAARAKAWERRADHLVMQARDEAERLPRWQPIARLLAQSDDVADALEEAAFLMTLIADHHQHGWNHEVRQILSRLAQTVLQAVQDHIRALSIARTLGSDSELTDNDAFLGATWAVLRAERQCDELLRHARRILLQEIDDAPSLMLANDLAQTLELASDRLLSVGYGLRDVAFNQAGA